MDQINLDEMADFLTSLDTSQFPNKNSALQFLTSVSAAVDREAASTKNPGEVHVQIEKARNNSTFSLGLIPTEKLIEVTSASTAVPAVSVAKILDKLDQRFLKHRLFDENLQSNPVNVEGFGTFENTGTELVFRPIAFEYLNKA